MPTRTRPRPPRAEDRHTVETRNGRFREVTESGVVKGTPGFELIEWLTRGPRLIALLILLGALFICALTAALGG
jgi:hypothetical protein